MAQSWWESVFGLLREVDHEDRLAQYHHDAVQAGPDLAHPEGPAHLLDVTHALL